MILQDYTKIATMRLMLQDKTRLGIRPRVRVSLRAFTLSYIMYDSPAFVPLNVFSLIIHCSDSSL